MVVTGPRDLGVVLFGATRRRLLAWLFGHPEEAFYFRELLRQTGAPEGAAQRELAALTSAGILSRTTRGNQVFFQANRACPIFTELLSIMTKTTGIAGVIREALEPLKQRIRAALLYGSAARNELRQGSDIDVMVVGDLEFGEVVDALHRVEPVLGREVNPTVYPPEEYFKKVREGHHFLNAVRREPRVFVLGGPGELGELESERVGNAAPGHEERDRRPPQRHRPRSEKQRRGRARP